jgi:hypothetical protein
MSMVDGKTAGECRVQWYSSVLTPAAKPSKRNASKNLPVEGDDDEIFNSTPMRGFLLALSAPCHETPREVITGALLHADAGRLGIYIGIERLEMIRLTTTSPLTILPSEPTRIQRALIKGQAARRSILQILFLFNRRMPRTTMLSNTMCDKMLRGTFSHCSKHCHHCTSIALMNRLMRSFGVGPTYHIKIRSPIA